MTGREAGGSAGKKKIKKARAGRTARDTAKGERQADPPPLGFRRAVGSQMRRLQDPAARSGEKGLVELEGLVERL